ncbi:MAG: transcriptional repressor LexA [Burkholderiales bacterium]
MHPLTARQTQILAVIRDFSESRGYPPTRAEIAQTLGFRSINAAKEHLEALARKGAIDLLPGTSRGIRLRGAAGLPLVGRVAAGSPMLAEQNIEVHLQIDGVLFKPRADYLLRVCGTSMRDAGILDGDLLAVHRTAEAQNNQIVVARLGDEVTVKRFKRRGHQVQLLPENHDFKPIVLDLRCDALVIEGLGVGVIRNGKTL